MPVINRSSTTNNPWNNEYSSTDYTDKTPKGVSVPSSFSTLASSLLSPSRWRSFFSSSTFSNPSSYSLPFTSPPPHSSSSSSTTSGRITLSYPHLYVDANQWSIRTYVGLCLLLTLTTSIVIHSFWTPLFGNTSIRTITISPLSGLRILIDHRTDQPCSSQELDHFYRLLIPYARLHNPSFYYTDVDTILPYLYTYRTIYTRRRSFLSPPLVASSPIPTSLPLPYQDDLLSYPLIIQIGSMDRKIIQRILTLYLLSSSSSSTTVTSQRPWEYLTITLSTSSNAAIQLPSTLSANFRQQPLEFPLPSFHRDHLLLLDQQWSNYVTNNYDKIIHLDSWLQQQQYIQFMTNNNGSTTDNTEDIPIGNRHIHLLTLTTRQGLEPLFLSGSQNLFRQGLVQYLLFEYTEYWLNHDNNNNHNNNPDYTLEKTLALLSSYNYVCFIVTIDGLLPVSAKFLFVSSSEYLKNIQNSHIFCGRQEDTDTVIIDSKHSSSSTGRSKEGKDSPSFSTIPSLYSSYLPTDTVSSVTSRYLSQNGPLRSIVENYNTRYFSTSTNALTPPPLKWFTESSCAWSSMMYRSSSDTKPVEPKNSS